MVMRMFEDRADAGRVLAQELLSRGVGVGGDVVVLAVPRGATVLAAEVARALSAQLDIVVVRKIGAPGNPEFAIAAVDGDGVVVGDPAHYAGPAYVTGETAAQRAEIVRREAAYRGGRPATQLRGRTVVLVDDGVATGLTALAAIGWLRRQGVERIVLATPVAAPGALPELTAAVDELVVLEAPADFRAVGQAYRDFAQVTDAEVVELLAASAG
jgi:predicted phosphoribosyltransferase